MPASSRHTPHRTSPRDTGALGSRRSSSLRRADWPTLGRCLPRKPSCRRTSDTSSLRGLPGGAQLGSEGFPSKSRRVRRRRPAERRAGVLRVDTREPRPPSPLRVNACDAGLDPRRLPLSRAYVRTGDPIRSLPVDHRSLGLPRMPPQRREDAVESFLQCHRPYEHVHVLRSLATPVDRGSGFVSPRVVSISRRFRPATEPCVRRRLPTRRTTVSRMLLRAVWRALSRSRESLLRVIRNEPASQPTRITLVGHTGRGDRSNALPRHLAVPLLFVRGRSSPYRFCSRHPRHRRKITEDGSSLASSPSIKAVPRTVIRSIADAASGRVPSTTDTREAGASLACTPANRRA